MKKKVALLLALVMVLSMMPMTAFGRTRGLVPLERPSTNPVLFRVELDAGQLSEIEVPAGYHLLLEFGVTGDNSGFRIFRNNSSIIDTNPATGLVRDTGERSIPSTWYPGSDPEGGFTGRLAFSITSGAGLVVGSSNAHMYRFNQLGAATANHLAPHAVTTFRDAFDAARGSSEWTGQFTTGVRRRLTDDRPGFTATESIGDRRLTEPMEHWRTITMSLDPLIHTLTPGSEDWVPYLDGWIEANRHAMTPNMEGSFNVFLPIAAGSPDAELRVTLRMQNPAGQRRTLHTFGTFDLAGDWGGVVNIESRGIAPIENIGRLNAIRITEDSNWGDTGFTSDWMTTNHIVRLVAPRNFRWDSGDMPGYLRGDDWNDLGNDNDSVNLRGNPTVWANSGAGPASLGVVREGGRATVLDTWLNPVTDRHEIYVHLVLPVRDIGHAAEAARAWVDIEGLVLIPLSNAPTTGDVAIDVWIGSTRGATEELGAWPSGQWGTGAANPTAAAENARWAGDLRNYGHALPFGRDAIFLLGDTLPDGRVRQTRFGWFGENDRPGSAAPQGVPGWRQNGWSRMNLVVGTLDIDDGITVTGPALPPALVSGRASAALDTFGNDRFMTGNEHTIRISENIQGAMFRDFDRYELRTTNDAVTIVDAEFRVGNEDAVDTEFAWRPVAQSPLNDANDYVVASLTEFDRGSLIFAPRTMEHERDDLLRQMDIRLMLSVEAAYQANYGNEIEIEVLRNGVLVGSVVVAEVTDPIRVERSIAPTEILRHQFDVIPMTPVGDFRIVETEAGNLATNDEIWVHVQATQEGRPVAIPQGMLQLFVGNFEVNTDESNLTLELMLGGVGNMPRTFTGDEIGSQVGFRVIRPSEGTPATIAFNNVYVAGPAVPGIDWHVVVTGAARAYNILVVSPGQPAVEGRAAGLEELVTVHRNPNFAVVTPSASATTTEIRIVEGETRTVDQIIADADLADTVEFVRIVQLIEVAAVEAQPFIAPGELQDLNRNLAWEGITPNSHRYFPAGINTVADPRIGDGQRLGVYQERARMFGIGYHATILNVTGTPDIDDTPPGTLPGFAFAGPRTFTTNTMIDGVQAIHFRSFGGSLVTMMSSRVFANHVGADIDWDDAARAVTISGRDRHGNEMVVVMTMGQEYALVNNVPVNIAAGAGQPQLGAIIPQMIDNRQYLPARFLANQFAVPIDFTGSGQNMVITLG